MVQSSKPMPRPLDPELTQPFWDATKRHELIIPRCRACNQYFWYPRAACPHCLRADWAWTPVSGRARLHTFTVVHQPQNPSFAEDTPYVFAIVQLDEGVRMISNVINCDAENDVAIDMPLKAVFDDLSDEWTLLKFEPA